MGNLGYDTTSLDDFTTVATTDAFSVQFVDHCEHDTNTNRYENDLSQDISTASHVDGDSELVSSMYLEHAEAELSEQGRTSGSDAYVVDRRCVQKIKSKSKTYPQTVAYAVDELYGSERGLMSTSLTIDESLLEAAAIVQRETTERKSVRSNKRKSSRSKGAHDDNGVYSNNDNNDGQNIRRRKTKPKSSTGKKASDEDIGTISEEERRELKVRLRRRAKAQLRETSSFTTPTGASGGGGRVPTSETTNENYDNNTTIDTIDTSDNRQLHEELDVDKLPKSRRYRALEKTYLRVQEQLQNSNYILTSTMEDYESLQRIIREKNAWTTQKVLYFFVQIAIGVFLCCYPIGKLIKNIEESPGLISHPEMKRIFAHYKLRDDSDYNDGKGYDEYFDYLEKSKVLEKHLNQCDVDMLSLTVDGQVCTNETIVETREPQSKLEALKIDNYVLREKYRVEKDKQMKHEIERDELRKQIKILLEYQNEVNAAGKLKLCQATHNRYAHELDQYTSTYIQTIDQLQRELFYYKASYTNLASIISTEQLQRRRQEEQHQVITEYKSDPPA